MIARLLSGGPHTSVHKATNCSIECHWVEMAGSVARLRRTPPDSGSDAAQM